MPRYYVTVTETATYRALVEAPDREAAKEIGEDAVADAITLKAGEGVELMAVTDRGVDSIDPYTKADEGSYPLPKTQEK